MAARAHLFLLFLVLPFMISAFVEQLPPGANAAQDEGFRMGITTRGSELPRSERIRKAIKRSYVRAKLLSSQASNSSAAPGDLALDDAGGDFSIKLLIGTPSQVFFLLMDTASDLVWVQCSYYYEYWLETYLSSTYQTIGCSDPLCRYITKNKCSNSSSTCKYDYHYRYGAGATGELATETIGLHTSHGISHFARFIFGCAGNGGGTDMYGFQPGVDGILGFGRGHLSFPSQLSSVVGRKFSYCLQVYSNASLMFFGSEAEIQQPDVQTTPFLTNAPSHGYYLNLTGIRVGGSSIRIPNQTFENGAGTLLDPGSTLTNFPASVHKLIRKAFIRRIPLDVIDGTRIGLDFCYDISSARNITFPSLVLEFENARIAPPQENYFFVPDPDTSQWFVCSALVPSDGNLTIIGNLMQQNYKILHDNAATTISFAPAECDKL